MLTNPTQFPKLSIHSMKQTIKVAQIIPIHLNNEFCSIEFKFAPKVHCSRVNAKLSKIKRKEKEKKKKRKRKEDEKKRSKTYKNKSV